MHSYFNNLLQNNKLNPYIRILTSNNESSPIPHLFVISAKNRDGLIRFLNKKNIPSFVRYPFPVNIVPAFSFIKKDKYIQAEVLSKTTLCLPFHQYLNKKDIRYMVSVIRKFYNKK